MGSVASVTTPSSAQHSKKLTHDEFRERMGSQYSTTLYHALCDENGLIPPQVIPSFSDPIEREVLSLFLEYSPKGVMKLGTFLKFCVEVKLLSKKNFSRKDAEVLFQKYSLAREEGEQINYLGLRYHIFQEISAIQRTSPFQLMSKIAECEGPMSRQEVSPPQSSSLVPAAAPASPVESASVGSDKLIALSAEQAELVRKACIQLQKLTRSTLAAKEALARKNMRKLSLVEKPNIMQALGPPSTLEEKTCHDLFLRFSSANEQMSLQDFYNFCHAASLISSSATFATAKKGNNGFTKSDAQHIFKKAMARFYDPATKTYAEGVLFGKRILYPVFRLVVLPDIAASQHLTLEEFLSLLVRVRRKISFVDEEGEEQEVEEETEKRRRGTGEIERRPSLSLLG